jgi:N-acetyl sugar amidotransferase
MTYCKRCLYSTTHPLNLIIDESGLCSGCVVHEEKDILDWNVRKEKLRSILEQYRNTSGTNYDCIIPVSGAKDSYFIVHTIKKEFGMNPLLVTYNKQYNTDLGIRNLANLRIAFDCDILTLSVDPAKLKKITRATLRRFGSMYWHCLAGQTVFPVQMAVKQKIPLIIWGAHQGIDQVGMFSHLDEVEMTRKYRKEHDLMGFEAEDLLDNEFDNITQTDITPFVYPDDKEIEHVGVRGIYLNNYIRWDSKAQHEEMIRTYGYETVEQTRTFDNYMDVDCFNYSDVHDYIKFLKHGYGKVTDHATREIRLKRMTREEGMELVKEYSLRPPQNLQLFLNWLGITEHSFSYIIDQHRNPFIWSRDENWNWILNASIAEANYSEEEIDKLRLTSTYDANYILTENARPEYDDSNYIIIGKGYYKPY